MRTKELPAKGTTLNNTARVSIQTAGIIAHLADRHGLPPALIAGTIAEIGTSLIAGPDNPCELVDERWNNIVYHLIRQIQPKAKCIIPILTTDWASQTSKQWSKDLNRPLDTWLGQMIELGIKHYHKREALDVVITDPENALFQTMAHSIREDHDSPEVDELLKPSPKVPSAFLSFEQILSSGDNAA